MAEIVTIPRQTQSVDQRFLIESLGGPQGVVSYLDRFPEEVYNKSIDSHLVRFMYALLGPAGAGHVRKSSLQARLLFEAHGLELFDLDRFYGNPLQFGRRAEEVFDENIDGLIPQDQWEEIRAKDAQYRNRILDFLAGVRAGNSPLGMRYVARSGLGHEVEIVENYKAIFDRYSDDPLSLPYYGKTDYLNEMVVLPRQNVSRSEVQRVSVLGAPTGGTFVLLTETAASDPIPYNATRHQLEIILAELFQTTYGNIQVYGGPLPEEAVTIRFLGPLAGRDIAQMTADSALTGGSSPKVVITTDVEGFDATEEAVAIKPRDQKHLQEAVDRIRPVGVIPTVVESAGVVSEINWVRADASSISDEMVRYVIGSGQVPWPARNHIYWIEPGIEHQAIRAHGDLGYHYAAFHEVSDVHSYGEAGITDVDYATPAWYGGKRRTYVADHIGTFEPRHSALFPFLRYVRGMDTTLKADAILADYAEPLSVDNVIETDGRTIGLINGIYPTDYQGLPGVAPVRYSTEQFWSSTEAPSGDVYIELDLGTIQAINFISLEITRKPVTLHVEYDVLGFETAERNFQPVTHPSALPNSRFIYFSPTDLNPWNKIDLYFTNGKCEMVYTRYVRLRFERRTQDGFLDSGIPWSIDVRNLRIGRNVANQ